MKNTLLGALLCLPFLVWCNHHTLKTSTLYSPSTTTFPAETIDASATLPLMNPDWHALGMGLGLTCHSIAIDQNGLVYAGGAFHQAGQGNADNIAVWDGDHWAPLGMGLNSICRGLAFDSNNHLYAVGTFTQAGGNPANYIAKWDGNQWQPLGEGLNGTARAIVIDSNDNVYVGGEFTMAGGNTALRIAMWDGSSWSGIDGGLSNHCYALAIDSEDNLYVGGKFVTAGNISASRIAKWDGNVWSNLGTGLGGTCHSIAITNSNQIIAGGTFQYASNTVVNNIAIWTNNGWTPIGTGTNYSVRSLLIDPFNNIYAGGIFTEVNNSLASRIARWDGFNWSALGEGVSSNCQTLAMDPDGDVFAGGTFNMAGGNPANYIARYDVNGSGIIALPIEWSGLDYQYNEGKVQLSWTTEMEFNNRGFYVQHSVDGFDWENIHFEVGQTNSQSVRLYQYQHKNHQIGDHYYRLKQVDLDEQYRYSNIIQLSIEKEASIKIFPNPGADWISFDGLSDSPASIEIYDLNGQLIEKQNRPTQPINIAHLAAGSYWVRLYMGQKIEVFQFSKK